MPYPIQQEIADLHYARFRLQSIDPEDYKMIHEGTLRTVEGVKHAMRRLNEMPRDAMFLNGYCIQMGMFQPEVIEELHSFLRNEHGFI